MAYNPCFRKAFIDKMPVREPRKEYGVSPLFIDAYKTSPCVWKWDDIHKALLFNCILPRLANSTHYDFYVKIPYSKIIEEANVVATEDKNEREIIYEALQFLKKNSYLKTLKDPWWGVLNTPCQLIDGLKDAGDYVVVSVNWNFRWFFFDNNEEAERLWMEEKYGKR